MGTAVRGAPTGCTVRLRLQSIREHAVNDRLVLETVAPRLAAVPCLAALLAARHSPDPLCWPETVNPRAHYSVALGRSSLSGCASSVPTASLSPTCPSLFVFPRPVTAPRGCTIERRLLDGLHCTCTRSARVEQQLASRYFSPRGPARGHLRMKRRRRRRLDFASLKRCHCD